MYHMNHMTTSDEVLVKTVSNKEGMARGDENKTRAIVFAAH